MTNQRAERCRLESAKTGDLLSQLEALGSGRLIFLKGTNAQTINSAPLCWKTTNAFRRCGAIDY